MSLSRVFRIEVTSSNPNRADILLAEMGVTDDLMLQISDFFVVEGNIEESDLGTLSHSLERELACEKLVCRISRLSAETDIAAKNVVEVEFKPDIRAGVSRQLMMAVNNLRNSNIELLSAGTRYTFGGVSAAKHNFEQMAVQMLNNEKISQIAVGDLKLLKPRSASPDDQPESLTSSELIVEMMAEGQLQLNGPEVEAVVSFYEQIGRDATPAELLTIAAFWAESQTQKSANGFIRVIGRPDVNSLIETYPKMATRRINASWVRSSFEHRGGRIEFDYDYELSFSLGSSFSNADNENNDAAGVALNRTLHGVLQLSHTPIALTQNFVSSDDQKAPNDRADISEMKQLSLQAGLPIVNSAWLSHKKHNRISACQVGAVGIGNRSRRKFLAEKDDLLFLIGGINSNHVAENSGYEINKIISVLDQAQEARLLNAVKSCAPAGLVYAAGIMGKTTGVVIELDSLLVGDNGWTPAQVCLETNSTGMLLAVPPDQAASIRDLLHDHDIAYNEIGQFTNKSGTVLRVTYEDQLIINLPTSFLIKVPPARLVADIPLPKSGPLVALAETFEHPGIESFPGMLVDLFAHQNVRNNEKIVRNLDTEISGISIIRPLVGKNREGVSDGAVLRPRETDGWRGLVLANGSAPFSDPIDSYAMAIISIDQAVRNAVSVGANPRRVALLATYLWNSIQEPEQLGLLVEVARGSYDAAFQLGTPFLDASVANGDDHLISDGVLNTMFVSSIGIHPDIQKAVSMDLKSTGSSIYLVGAWTPYLGGSHILAIHPDTALARSFPPPKSLPEQTTAVYHALHQAILSGTVCAAHDLGEGGLIAAAAEMALAGRLGLELDLSTLHESPFIALFAETPGCLLVEVALEDSDTFEMEFAKLPFRRIGIVDVPGTLSVMHKEKQVLKMDIDNLVRLAQQKGGDLGNP